MQEILDLQKLSSDDGTNNQMNSLILDPRTTRLLTWSTISNYC